MNPVEKFFRSVLMISRSELISRFFFLPRMIVLGATVFLAGTGLGEEAAPSPPHVLQERTEDLRAMLTAELAAGKKKIVIPPGRYRLKPQQGSHLWLKDLRDVEIIAENVELVCGATIKAIGFDRCAHVTLRGLTIDYDPLPFCQGTIVALGPEKSWMEFELCEGYAVHELENKIEIYQPDSRELRRASHYGWSDLTATGPRRYRISKGEKYRYREQVDTEVVGDWLVIDNRTKEKASTHAIELRECSGMRLEDITLYASPCFGFLERDSTASTYLRCRIDRRPPELDPVKRAQPRLRSLNADAYHSKDAAKGPAIISCTARYHADDCVNINGRYHYVASSSGKKLRVAVLDHGPNFKAGEPVSFLPYAGPRPEDAVVTAIQPDPTPITEQEKTLLRQQHLDARIRDELLSHKTSWFTLTLDRDIALTPGSAVCCPLRLGHGFAVKDCDFGPNRSRGILVKASEGEISRNRIHDTWMPAILLTAEFWWMEAGLCRDVMIRDNRITSCRDTAIEIRARSGNRRLLPAGAHRNISLLDNRMEDSAWPMIHVTSTSGLVMEGNVLPATVPARFATKADPAAQPILLENCEIIRQSQDSPVPR